MFASPARRRRWSGPSRRLLLALVAVSLASAGSLSWLGWAMLRQDADAEAQRAQERLDHQVDLAVQSLERLLAATEDHLADWASRPSTPPPDPANGGVVVTFAPAGRAPSPSSRLLFYPDLARRPEPAADLFAEGERAEFQQHDYVRAAQIFRQLAGSPDHLDRPDRADRTVRAAALLRLGRTLKASERSPEALAVYAEMAALGDVPVFGSPADLVARSARMQLLAEIGQREAARKEARNLGEDLAQAHWKLTRGQYEHYVDVRPRIGKCLNNSSHEQPAAVALVEGGDRTREVCAGECPAGPGFEKIAKPPSGRCSWRAWINPRLVTKTNEPPSPLLTETGPALHISVTLEATHRR